MAVAEAPGVVRQRARRLRWPATTARLRLELPATRHLDELVRALRDRRITDPTTIPYPYPVAEGRKFVAATATKVRAGGGFDALAFSREDGHLVGGLGLILRWPDRRPSVGEIGYWVAVPDWGRGYGTEILDWLVATALGELRLHRVEAWVKGYNDASYHLLRRAGFLEEGRARESVYHRGKFHDRILLGRLRSDRATVSGGPDRPGARRASSPGRPTRPR